MTTRGLLARRGMRRAGAVVAVVLSALLVSACGGAVGSLIRADSSLAASGYQSPQVSPAAGFGSSNANGVNVSASLAEPPTPGDLKQVARIIWVDVHVRFDDVAITLHGGGQTAKATYTFAQLQQAFGARDPAWNATTLQTSVVHLGVAILVGFVGLVAVVVVIVAVAVRRRRRNRRPPSPPSASGWPGPGYPPPPAAYPLVGRWAPAPESGLHPGPSEPDGRRPTHSFAPGGEDVGVGVAGALPRHPRR